MVTLRRFQQFIAVADELSFRRAAERLRMAQPPLTMAIQKLEEELGTALFQRRGRQIDLTAAGAMFLEEARLAVTQAERAVAVARSAHKGIIGNLRIGYTASTAYELMPLILKQYRAERPDVRLTLYEYPTWDQLDQLRAKHLDVGILRQPPSWPPGVRHKILARERLVALVPRQHRLAARRRIKLAELRDEPIVLFPPSWANRHHDRIVEACAAVGFVPRVVQEAAGMLGVFSFVASGVGIGFGPRSLRNLHQGEVAYCEFADDLDQLYFDLAIAWHEERQLPAARDFIAVAQRAVKSSSIVDR